MEVTGHVKNVNIIKLSFSLILFIIHLYINYIILIGDIVLKYGCIYGILRII